LNLAEAQNMEFLISQVKLYETEVFGIRKIKLPNENSKEVCLLSFLKYDMFILSSLKGVVLFKYKISEPLALEWNI